MTKYLPIQPKPVDLMGKDIKNQNQQRAIIKPKRDKRIYQCVECEEVFTNYTNLKVHADNCLTMGPKGALNICQYCNVLLDNINELNTHNTDCHTDAKYECFCCKKRFIQKGHLHNHAQKVHGYKSLQYYCMLCDKATITRFDTKSELSKHYNQMHTECLATKGTECGISENLADDEDDVEMQDLEWLDDCLDMDNMSFSTSWEAFDFDLSKVLNATSEAGDATSNKSLSPPPLQPSTSTPQSPFICPLCQCECDKALMLIKHVAFQHKELHKQQQNQSTEYNCVYCKKEFTNILHYKRHLDRMHISVLRHECFFCQRAFSTMDHLKKHVLSIHQNERRFFCTHCNAAFTQSGHLKQHLETHSGVKRFNCSQCLKAFHRAIDLKRHKCKAKLNDDDNDVNDR